jgi:hypothetical protein
VVLPGDRDGRRLLGRVLGGVERRDDDLEDVLGHVVVDLAGAGDAIFSAGGYILPSARRGGP